MALHIIKNSSGAAPTPTYPVRAITIYAFRSRFTQAEKVQLELASIDNPEASMQQRQAAAALRVFLADVAVARYIDLDLPATRAGVQQLETMGLLAEGRAAMILDNPVLNAERPEPILMINGYPADQQPEPEEPAPEPAPAPTP